LGNSEKLVHELYKFDFTTATQYTRKKDLYSKNLFRQVK